MAKLRSLLVASEMGDVDLRTVTNSERGVGGEAAGREHRSKGDLDGCGWRIWGERRIEWDNVVLYGEYVLNQKLVRAIQAARLACKISPMCLVPVDHRGRSGGFHLAGICDDVHLAGPRGVRVHHAKTLAR